MATVTASYNWVSGETVTPAKLNTTAAPTVVVADNEITTAKILDANVTTAKIADANVTNAKLATGIDASKLTTGTLPIARIADAAVIPAKLSQPLTLATAQNTTSGTSIDFTGIPSWVKRITIIFDGVSVSGSSNILIQLGNSGGFANSGYVASSSSGASSVATTTATAGFNIRTTTASDLLYGTMSIVNVGSTLWVSSHCLGSVAFFVGGGVKAISSLNSVRLTTVSGTDTFDAGLVNIMYEG